MRFNDMTIQAFIDDVDSKKPAPGGGTVSALAAQTGVSLIRMVAHLTRGKKKFKALDDKVQDRFNKVFHDFASYKTEFAKLMDEDTEAFNKIMDAFKLPKDTDEQKELRKEKIAEASEEAIEVPLRIAKLAYRALQYADIIMEYGNKHAISDIGVGASMLFSAIESALLNVKINLPGLDDDTTVFHYKKEADDLLLLARDKKEAVLKYINQYLDD